LALQACATENGVPFYPSLINSDLAHIFPRNRPFREEIIPNFPLENREMQSPVRYSTWSFLKLYLKLCCEDFFPDRCIDPLCRGPRGRDRLSKHVPSLSFEGAERVNILRCRQGTLCKLVQAANCPRLRY
jgi:hypothetical protein